MIAQIIYLLIVFIGLLLHAHDHGKPKEGKDNFWKALIAAMITLALLWWGGFFDVILNKF